MSEMTADQAQAIELKSILAQLESEVAAQAKEHSSPEPPCDAVFLEGAQQLDALARTPVQPGDYKIVIDENVAHGRRCWSGLAGEL